ncbi:helicase-exonuclease AddAB subunit AddB [Brevibacillus daliensis]|uniref:helicase-exonuclease AddAB subunit AddB n=1 Tax=Brevibacillus daliensis TaxID=2892995 RepID=UPI001E395BDE|nr:helicase-exonuclease AddAB subunit AddB [Brevibacillus daliensis]
MALQFYLGRAGTGKTEKILSQIQEKLRNDRKGAPLIYLVPEQATFQEEHRLVTTAGFTGHIRAQVLSFGRLSHRILQEVGGLTTIPIDDRGKQMVLRLLLERNQEQLKVFNRSALQPGFAGELAQMISECKSYGVSVEQLEQLDIQNATLENKLHDLLLLMRAYEEYLTDTYFDNDELYSIVAERLAESNFIKDAEIWLDGFSGFTTQEYKLIEQVMRCAKQVTIALCFDPDDRNKPIDDLSCFYPVHDTYEKLKEIATQAGIPIDEPIIFEDKLRFVDSPWLSQVEESYFHWKKPGTLPSPRQEDEVVMISAANRRAEVQGLALYMLSLTRTEGYRYRDMAVLLRDMEPYADEIASTFTEYGIPFFLDQKRRVTHHPLIELIRSSLETVTGNWRYDAVFRALKTDLLSPIDISHRESRSEIDLLENYVIGYGIHGGYWSQSDPWSFHGDQALYEEIGRIRGRYATPLQEFEREIKQASKKNTKHMASVLYDYLLALQVPQKLEEWQKQAEQDHDLESFREHEQVWNDVMELLDQVVEVMGEEKLDVAIFSKIMETGMESIRMGLVPPALDQVLIGSMERSRQPDVKALFILGATEGVIPLRPKEEGILSETERDKLENVGIELGPNAKRKLMSEQYLLYRALTRASERLWISCPLADEEGKALLPSGLFNEMKKTLPGLTLGYFHNEPTSEPDRDMILLGRPRQAFRHMLTLVRQVKKGIALPAFWWEVYDWYLQHSTDEKREKWLLSGLHYENKAYPLSKKVSKRLYGEEIRMSVSRLEKFQACPYSHFASHGLRLMERQQFRLERFDVGELFHASLKLAVEEMNKQQLDWGQMNETSSMKLADHVVEELVPQTRSSILARTARYRYVTGKLKRAVGRAITVLGEHARRSHFAPIGLEISFGPGGEIPGMTIELEDGMRIHLLGRIDRIDQSLDTETSYLRVIDYKSGPKALILSDVWNGLNLQLLVYLDVAVTNADKWLNKEVEVGGVFYYQVADPFVSAKQLLTPDQVAKERQSKLKMKGLMLADPELARLMDNETETGTSDLLPFGIKKDGEFTSYSSVASRKEFDILRQYVRGSIKKLGRRLVDGDISIEPYLQGQMNACQICSYRSVCQFDQLLDGNQPRLITRKKDQEVWGLIRQEMGEESHEQ